MKPVVENDKGPELRQPPHLNCASARLRGHFLRHLCRPRFLSFAPLHLTILQLSFRPPPPPPTLPSFPPPLFIFPFSHSFYCLTHFSLSAPLIIFCFPTNIFSFMLLFLILLLYSLLFLFIHLLRSAFSFLFTNTSSCFTISNL